MIIFPYTLIDIQILINATPRAEKSENKHKPSVLVFSV